MNRSPLFGDPLCIALSCVRRPLVVERDAINRVYVRLSSRVAVRNWYPTTLKATRPMKELTRCLISPRAS